MTLGTKPSAKEGQDNIQRTELGAATVDSLLEKLNTADDAHDTSARTQLYLKFKALVYTHPETCERLGAVLSAADAHGQTFTVLMSALGAIGSPEAQTALLAGLKAHSTDTNAVAGLLPVLAQTPNPTPETEAAIRKIEVEATDPMLSSMALMALGNLAHSLEKPSPDRAQHIVDELAGQLKPDVIESKAHDILEALGNTGMAAAMPAIGRYLKDDSPRLRAATMDALRFMPPSLSDDLLVSGLSDTDSNTRLEAAFSLSFKAMPANLFAAEKSALASDDNEKVRASLLQNLWKNRTQYAEAEALVQQAAEHDPSEYVRKVAAGLLGEAR
jgi:HEAT repeat protein